MNTQEYVQSLQGVTNKEDILSALDSVIQDLGTKTHPIVATAAAAFKSIKLKSPEIIAYDERYRNDFRLGRGASVFGDLQERLRAVSINLTSLRGLIEKTVPDTVTPSSIDHRTATLMQLVDNASFVMRYIRRFIEAAVVYETEQTGIYDDYIKQNLTKGEITWLHNRFPAFLTMMDGLSLSQTDFIKKFEGIPAIRVDEHSTADAGMFGRDKVDPFRLHFLATSLNPFFLVGRWVAEYQVKRFKESQEDLARIQKRIMLLEEATAGKANPKIEKELTILRDKSEGLIYSINKAEEEVA